MEIVRVFGSLENVWKKDLSVVKKYFMSTEKDKRKRWRDFLKNWGKQRGKLVRHWEN
jgi:glucuronate isomerase